ncbi:MAG TPA: hypothetical protein VJ908_11865 [Wenzhouxiangellaceae bacterium]|nr:hypothetical protein [Wenzhouxiangellaceae bacterium]
MTRYFQYALILSAPLALQDVMAETGDGAQQTAGPVVVIDGLSGPEAVHYDVEQDVYFVSNFNGDAAGDANGFISRVAPGGEIETLEFMVGTSEFPLHGPRGMRIVDEVLWVADADGLHGFDRRSGEQLKFIDFSGHAPGFLNDVEADPAGALYLTDTGNARLFKVDNGEITVLAADELESPPNGIVWYPAARAFVLAPWGDGLDLKAWRPDAGELVELGRLPEGGNIDGLEEYDGRLIVASQVDQAIWSWRDGAAMKLFDTPGRPADIGIDSRRGRVAIPYIALDRVELWALPERQ